MISSSSPGTGVGVGVAYERPVNTGGPDGFLSRYGSLLIVGGAGVAATRGRVDLSVWPTATVAIEAASVAASSILFILQSSPSQLLGESADLINTLTVSFAAIFDREIGWQAR